MEESTAIQGQKRKRYQGKHEQQLMVAKKKKKKRQCTHECNTEGHLHNHCCCGK